MKKLSLAAASLLFGITTLFANGGAGQTGVPGTGSASATNQNRKTDVTIEDETLKIDLHPDYAAVDVRYRMHNTGPKVQQDFFFPVERWGRIQTSDEDRDSDDIGPYHISVDGKELKWTNVAGPKEKSSEPKEGTSGVTAESSKSDQEGTESKKEDTTAEEGKS